MIVVEAGVIMYDEEFAQQITSQEKTPLSSFDRTYVYHDHISFFKDYCLSLVFGHKAI